MDFLILTLLGSKTEYRVNLHHIIEIYPASPNNENAGTVITMIGGNEQTVSETIPKIEVAIRKLGGKLVGA